MVLDITTKGWWFLTPMYIFLAAGMTMAVMSIIIATVDLKAAVHHALAQVMVRRTLAAGEAQGDETRF
jgi:hypothetical protein